MLRSYEEVADALRRCRARRTGHRLSSAAMGIALGARQSVGTSVADLEFDSDYMCEVMSKTRPTAVNLFWAIERMHAVFNRAKTQSENVEEIKELLVAEAKAVYKEDLESNRSMGRFGGELLADGATVLTHCNAGALAARRLRHALGVIRGARDAGKRIAVIADETRPFLQGARLTALELHKDDIPVTLITDKHGGHVMKQGSGGRRRSRADRSLPMVTRLTRSDVPVAVLATTSDSLLCRRAHLDD